MAEERRGWLVFCWGRFVWGKGGGEREGDASWLASTHPLFHFYPYPTISRVGGRPWLLCFLPLPFCEEVDLSQKGWRVECGGEHGKVKT